MLLTLAVFFPLWISMTATAQNNSHLTGEIHDHGIDTDGDGLYNYLVVELEANITVDGSYTLQVNGLKDENGGYVWFFAYNTTYLTAGMHNIRVSFKGIPIRGSRINVTRICEVYFSDSNGFLLSNFMEISLTRMYKCTEFDTGAVFTDKVYDEGVDTDDNGLYDYLNITVEVNVTDTGTYSVNIWELANASYSYVTVGAYSENSLTPGLHNVSLSIYGPKIYNSGVTNISRIDWLGLNFIDVDTHWSYMLDYRFSLNLSKSYNYTQFDGHASLTGKISDSGEDSDGDGLFDYLVIGVEINVTKAGRYRVYVEDLIEQNTAIRHLYLPQWVEDYFTEGTHTVYFKYYGPRLAYERLSPTHAYGLHLYETDTGIELEYIPDAPLSQKYDYTLFNAPLKDMQFNFTVYPNGTVGVDGAVNFTHMYPENMGPALNASIDFSTTGTTTTGSIYGSIALPTDGMFGWPFNSASANFTSKYEGGLLNTTLDLTMSPPPGAMGTYPFNASNFNLEALYANGLLNVSMQGDTEIPSYETMFPLNMTDLTVLANYINNQLEGNITLRLIPGVPTMDVIVYFNGNKTDLRLTGHVNVTYGNYFGIEINSTSLEQMLAEINGTVPGPMGLVANMTWGLLECTQLNTTKTEWPDGLGADVQYNATINGNFTMFFAKILNQILFGVSSESEQFVYAALDSAFSSVESASLRIDYYHTSGDASMDLNLTCNIEALWSKALEQVPSTVPGCEEQVLAWLKIANATAYTVTDFRMEATYSSSSQRLNLHARLLTDAIQLENDLIAILPEAVPPELRGLVESYLSVKYGELTSSEATISYVNGKADFDVTFVFEGDFKAQVNHEKSFYIEYLKTTAPWMIPWQPQMLNETEININNFSAEYKMSRDWMQMTFNGLIIKPPKDEIDLVRFQLYRFFNMTSNTNESPIEFEKLKITITGASNGTHTILIYAPSTVPLPDNISLDYRTMIWENVSLSSLKDLEFRIAYQQIVNYAGTHNVIIFTNSTVSNFNFNPNAKTISFNVTGTSGTGFCNITIPRALIYASPQNWIVKLDSNTLPAGSYSVTENAEYVFIYLAYSHSTHRIEIEGTWVISEYQPNMFLIVLAILSLIAVIVAFKQRKRITLAKTRCQTMIQAFASKIHMFRA